MEATGLPESQQLADLRQAVRRVAQIVVGQLPARIVEHIAKGRPFTGESTLQDTLADLEPLSRRRHVTASEADVFHQPASGTFPVGCLSQLVHAMLGEAAMQQCQRLVGRTQRSQQRLLIEHNAIALRAKTQGTVEQALVFGDIQWLGIGELDRMQPGQTASGQPATEPHQRSQAGILDRPGLGLCLEIIDAPDTGAPFIPRYTYPGPGSKQRLVAYQGIQCRFQVRTGHHGVAHQLKSTRQKMPVGAQTDIRVARLDLRQRHQTIDIRPPHETIRQPQ